jgi:RNA polymerase sigma factor (sigma-70 family)
LRSHFLWQHAGIGEGGSCIVNRFQTTRWSMVLEARGGSDAARRALEELCRTYRAPVIGYILARVHHPEESEDLAQAFFARFIEHAYHANADPTRGSFRAFLLTALKRFLADSSESTRALKRGGNIQFQALDSITPGTAEGGVEAETPEHVFERAWAEAILRAAMRKLRAETAAAGKSALFDQMAEFLIERPSDSDYTRIADAFNMRRNTIAVAAHRLRLRLRELVREEMADTTADDTGLDGELDQLRKSLPALEASSDKMR